MIAERRFRRTVLLTAITGHLAYTLAAEKPGLAILGLMCAALSAWLVNKELSGTPRPLPRAILNSLVIVAIIYLILQLIGRSQEVITSLTDFLAYVMLVKSLDRARMRDEAQLLGLSLFVVIGALLTGQSLSMGLALLAYTPLAIVSTVSIQLYAARERQQDILRSVGLADQTAAVDAQLVRQRSPRALTSVAVFCVLTSMGAGVFAFLITPRQLAQQLGIASGPMVRSPATGYSDSIHLGASGNINEDATPVMDVKVLTEGRGNTGPIYLRGGVLNRYDPERGTWTGPASDDRYTPYNLPSPNDIQQARSLTVPHAEEARVRTQYEIIQRNTKNASDAPLFAPYHPIAVTTEARNPIKYRAEDALLRISTPGGRLVYTVTSSPDYKDASVDRATPPASSYSPRIKQLADSIIAQRKIDPAKFADDPIEIRRAAQAIIAHLSGFKYTLEMVAPPEGQDPLEAFLFDRQMGHCEYFASAMTVMLQSIGIPARVATGFAVAEYNSVTGYYTVRQSDAHAWVEVRMEPGRWDTFDPTPPGNLQSSRRASGGLYGWAKQLWDAVEFSWLDNVVAYDKGIKLDTLGIARNTDPGALAVRWSARLRAIQDWVRTHLPEGVLTRSLIVGVLTFGLVMGLYWLARVGGRFFAPFRAWFARFMPGRTGSGSDDVPIPREAAFYRDALAALNAGGVPKPAVTPPLTHAHSLKPAACGPLALVASLYYRARFDGVTLSDQQQATGREAVERLRESLRRGQ